MIVKALFAALAAVGLTVSGYGLATSTAAKSCCYEGSPCCYAGSPCCDRRPLLHRGGRVLRVKPPLLRHAGVL